MKGKSLEIKRMHIKYVFTEDEKVAMAGELAQKMSEKADLELQKKEVASKFTSDINRLDAALAKISGEYRQGYTYKNHDCYEVFDYDTKQVFTHRADTDEQVSARTMTTAEIQRELFDPREEIPIKNPIAEYLNDELIENKKENI